MTTDPPGAGDPPWHALAVAEVFDRLGPRPGGGLDPDEAARRLREHGPNALPAAAERSVLALLLDQFLSLVVGLLVAAAAVSFALGEWVEGVAVVAVLLANAGVGFATEWRARQALTALRDMAAPTAQVVRAGRAARVPAADLVPGDLVVLAAGDRVPADGRVVEAARLAVEEAALTGESVPAGKGVAPVPDPAAPLAERTDMAFLGTTVTAGRGLLLVTATGRRTEVGRIGALVEQAGDPATPLERKLAQLGRALVGVVLAVCGTVVLAGWARGGDLLPALRVGISLAVAAVPEGLPAVATMTLALGVRRMARRRALVRRLPAVETLGSTTVICTDKTGTLTRNRMTAQVYQLGDRRLDAGGAGPAADAHLLLALRVGTLCSDAALDGATVLGDPTEGALLVAAAGAGIAKPDLQRDHPRVGEVPFSSETMRMTTVHRGPGGETVAHVKGAPASVLAACSGEWTAAGVRPLASARREWYEGQNRELAGDGLRVLALATKPVPADFTPADLADGLVLVGLVGLADPLREAAGPAVERCRVAGIRVVMITGDQPATAAAIGRQLGLDRGPDGRPLRVIHGRELAGLDAAGWQAVVADAGVFARVSPEHKLRIVEAFQAAGEVVAMTGDGVNDAPALKRADIGVAMGGAGTAAAKEAADLVLTDDDFATVVAAVAEGRAIYANVLRFVRYLFACNLAEVLAVGAAVLAGWPLPLAPLQVLWLNLVTDVFPALALALEPAAPDAMTRPPRNPREPLVSRAFLLAVGWQGGLMAALTLGVFGVGLRWYGAGPDGVRHAATLAFTALTLGQLAHALNARSGRRSAFGPGWFANPWVWAAVGSGVLVQLVAVYWSPLQAVLHTVPLTPADWLAVAACPVALVAAVEAVKWVRRVH